MKKTPLQEVKEKFGSKENLIKELKKIFDAGDLFENRLNVDKGIATVANAKLLKLFQVAEEVKGRFSTRANLIEDMLKVMGRIKDEGLKSRLEKWTLPRLWDHYQSVVKKQSAARKKQPEKQ
jgi:hypothetical protein